MGMLTAALWKIFGVHLWISHLLTLICFFVLLYQTLKLVEKFFPAHQGWMGHAGRFYGSFTFGSIFHSFTRFYFVNCFHSFAQGIIRKKYMAFVHALIFLFGINMRGIFAGIAFMDQFSAFSLSQFGEKFSFTCWLQSIRPFAGYYFITDLFYFLLSDEWLVFGSF